MRMVQYRIGNIKIYYRMEDDVRKDFKSRRKIPGRTLSFAMVVPF